jgi:thiol:disulfide interchange protein DsbD
MLRRLLYLSLCYAFATLAACGGAGDDNRSAAPSNAAQTGAGGAPRADVVRASVSELRLPAGGSAEAVVRVNISEGFHVNSNAPGDKFLIPTRLEAAPPAGLKAGAASYPPGVTKKFAFSEQPLSVYEGEVPVRLPLSAEGGATKGRHTVNVSLTVQPCDDRECFPPRTINAAIPVVVE